MDSRCRIQLLGGLQVLQGERSITRFRTQKGGVLLAYLAFYLQQAHPREVLIEMLWPECEPSVGRQRLSLALSSLRRQLEPPGVPAGAVIQANRFSVQLNYEAIATDVGEFHTALQSAARTESANEREQLLITAIDLYRNRLLPGVYEDWVLQEQQHLADLYYQAVSQLVSHLEQTGALERGIQVARRAITLDPLREEAHLHLMRLYAAAGQPSHALRQYRELESLLAKELLAKPSEEARALADRLRSKSDVRTTTSAQNRPSFPTQNRQHPERARISESPSAPPIPTPSLPVQITRFFGREDEIARLQELLSPVMEPCRHRLVTLTGAGGTGKTRLAIEVAGRLSEAFQGAVWFVPLAGLSDPRQIPGALVEAMRLPYVPHVQPLEQAIERLARQPALLVLDNFEHLLAGDRVKAEDGSVLARVLLERVPALTCLVTARQLLSLEGEREFAVSPLPIPEAAISPEQLVQCESVQLFVDRAQAVRADFQVTRQNASTVAMLCARLEGIPLAIEMAAARAQVLTSAQMLSQLEDRFQFLVSRRRDAIDRHRTLRAAIDWSYRLLPAELQRFFARLSVFRGGWTAEGAKAVCVEPLALDYLALLRESSLVLAEESQAGMRFRMLETLREYAGQQLSQQGRQECGRRHAGYFLALAEEEDARPRTNYSTPLLRTEYDNLRMALEWYYTAPDGAETGLRLACAIWPPWGGSYYREGRVWLERMLGKDNAPQSLRGYALNCACILAQVEGDVKAARSYYERSLAIRRELEDKPGIARVMCNMAHPVLCQGDYALARSLYQQSLDIYMEQQHTDGISCSYRGLGLVAFAVGDCPLARSLLEKSLALQKEIGPERLIASWLNELGQIALVEKNYQLARALFEKCLSQALGYGEAQCGLAEVARFEGDYIMARSLFVLLLQTLRTEEFNPFWTAYYLERFAALLEAEGQARKAAQLCAASAASRESNGMPMPPVNHIAFYDNLLTGLKDCLGEAEFAAAWQAGSNMPLMQAIEYALCDSHS
ncbi:MAG TPA: tetratricopeptide repeat protein [Chthonomonadaceae bacterium]|nr:tetratricopeptide repeat protein [Chthonomonadaceae bacterium]